MKSTRRQSKGEEIANTITHGIAAYLVLIFNPIITINTYKKYDIIGVISITVFILSIFSMFLCSCLYHAMKPNSKHKDVFHILDHIFIFVAIAGTYTPISLLIIGGIQGYIILIIQWFSVLWGILYKAILDKKNPRATVVIYLIMGWTVVIFGYTFFKNSNLGMLLLILLGGIFYSLGSFFYRKKNIKFMHMVWHVFVFLGACSQYLALLLFL